MYSHEQAFVERFVRGDRRPRYLALLASEKKRRKLIAKLAHFRDFDDRRVSLIPAHQQSATQILALLSKPARPTSVMSSRKLGIWTSRR